MVYRIYLSQNKAKIRRSLDYATFKIRINFHLLTQMYKRATDPEYVDAKKQTPTELQGQAIAYSSSSTTTHQ